MLEQVHGALAEFAEEYRDARLHHVQVAAETLEGGHCTLSGTVLDDPTLRALERRLDSDFPEITFDTSRIRVLRPGESVTVGTTVTGLFAAPSFRAEMVSQMLNGWSVELLIEQERWAFVRQSDGYLGWTYRPYLTGEPALAPTHIVSAPVALVRDAPNAALVSRLPGGTAVRVTDLLERSGAAGEAVWANVALAGELAGWLERVDLRALDGLPTDDVARRHQMAQDAAQFIGVPYLWGGCTALGIDCSGLAQLLYRLVGVTIPRDADMQHDAGRPAETPYQPGDLLFFCAEGGRRAITHVAMSLGGWRIVHASRARNGVYEDDVQSVPHLRDSFVGARTLLL